MVDRLLDALGLLWQPDLIIAVQRLLGREWRLAYEALSLLGGAQITLVAVAWARWFHGRGLAARLLVALFLGIGIDLLIWNLFPTPRPDDPRVWVSTDIPIASFPSGHLVTVMTLCDAPSCVSTSGDTDTVIDFANSDGPVSGGASCSFIVHAAARSRSAKSTRPRVPPRIV